MFEISEFHEATLKSMTTRAEHHGDDEVPAVTLALAIETENFLLDIIDPTPRQALYKAKDEQQETVDGVPPSTPVLRSNSIDLVKLPTKHEGWTLQVDDDLDESNAAMFGGCKVDSFTVEPKQGGTIVLGLRVSTSDVDADRLGMLAMHVRQSVWIKLIAPKKSDKGPEDGDGSEGGETDATSLFVGEHAEA